jgi:hypothetical protein
MISILRKNQIKTLKNVIAAADFFKIYNLFYDLQ